MSAKFEHKWEVRVHKKEWKLNNLQAGYFINLLFVSM